MNNGINVNLNHWPAMDLIQIFKVHKKYDSVVWTSSMCPYICLQSESVFSFETLLWISRKLYSYVFAQPSWILSHSLSRICTWVACCGALFRPLQCSSSGIATGLLPYYGPVRLEPIEQFLWSTVTFSWKIQNKPWTTQKGWGEGNALWPPST